MKVYHTYLRLTVASYTLAEGYGYGVTFEHGHVQFVISDRSGGGSIASDMRLLSRGIDINFRL
jgi:galactose-1-phosphate uridylyltransferase